MRKLRLVITLTFALLCISYVYTIRKTFVQISNVSLNPNVQPLGDAEKQILTQRRNTEILQKVDRTSTPPEREEIKRPIESDLETPTPPPSFKMPPNPNNIPNCCDLTNLPNVVISGSRVYDFFPMNHETEIGFVVPRSLPHFTCVFPNGDTSKSSSVHNGYLWASLAYCSLPPVVTQSLHDNLYLDFKVEWIGGSIELRVCYDPAAPQFYVSDCCIYRQDENIVEQWLQWNTMLGMEHFYMYDHQSTDKTNKILQRYIDDGLVTYVNWRNYRPEPHTINTYHEAQDSMIISCLARNRDNNKWIFMGDTDEFIYPIKENNFVYALEKYENDDSVDGIRLHGYMWIDDIKNPLPLVPDPSKQTTLIEEYPLNMTFAQKYQYEWRAYETYKTFVKTHKPMLSGLHNLNGMGKEYNYDEEELKFIHFRMERYGRPSTPGKYDPRPYERFGKKIHL